MKECFKIEIQSWTSSFRDPLFITKYQPTLEVPSVCTVLGLINSVSGEHLSYKDFEIGYHFEYDSKYENLEIIHQMMLNKNNKVNNNVKSNIITRELLIDTKLTIYLTDESIVDNFRKPVYPVLLGRSTDLANIKVYKEKVILEENRNPTKIKGQVVPYSLYPFGKPRTLATYFNNDNPRLPLECKLYSVINHNTPDVKLNMELLTYRDNIREQEIDIFFHNINL